MYFCGMDHAMDPYEQQLLSVFNSYDVSHRGSLDQESLQQLCNSLHLEERGVELVNCLLSDSKTHVTFLEFKDGLLALLGNVQHNNRQKQHDDDLTDDSDAEAGDREISPKFVFGSKKYGRRSRPESTEQIELFDSSPDTNLEKNTEVFTASKYENKPLKNVNKVQRSNSQSDVTYSRKRKTSGKLKRCTSFPGNHEMKTWNQHQDKHLKDSNIHLTVSEYYNSMLQSALEQLELGLDGYLNHLEIIRVCEFMGMHKLAKGLIKQLSGKEEADLNRSYTVEEFLEILQSTEDVVVFDDDDDDDDTSTQISLNSTTNNSCLTDDFGNKPLQYITLGPNGSGVISSQAVVELWENAGIVSATSLLQGLGFTGPNIDIIDLATILDEELRSMNESHTDISYNNINPHIILLQASIVLYQSEVKYLKSLLEQLTAERDKLRTDIADANHRASLLAQEVDDNHAKMEKRTQDQVRFLEQRHADMVKELSSQFLSEKEQMSGVNTNLETKIITLEAEEARLRSDLQTLQKYNNNLEKENSSLANKLSDLEFQRTSLTEKVGLLENECQKITEIERERDQLEPLLKKLSILQLENAELRDKNDELSTTVESLKMTKNKSSSTPTFNVSSSNAEENVSVICEGVGSGLGAIKRRVDSPCKENINECGLETESPRLGKVRRCYQKNQPEILLDALGTTTGTHLHLPPFNSSESGFEADLDCLDSSLSFTGSDYSFQVEEVVKLRARITELEKQLENVIAMSANPAAGGCLNDIQDRFQYMKRCKQLETVLEGVQSSVTDMMKNKSECKDITDLLNPMTQLSDKLKNIALDSSSEESLNSSVSTSTVITNDLIIMQKIDTCTETDDSFLKIKETLESKEKENKTLLDRCEELELALDLLRNEFENCENYWANKLDDERRLSEQDLKQSNEKLAELLIKISEYEQFTANDIINEDDGRLSPIEEKGMLEQQFTELEEEYEHFKCNMETKLEQRDQYIAALEQQLNEKTVKTVNESSVQVDLIENATENKMTNLSNVIESTNIFSSETLPHAWQYTRNSQNILQKIHSGDSSVITSNLSNISSIPERERECERGHERDYINPNIWMKNGNDMIDNIDEPFIETVSSTSTTNSISSIKSDMHTCSSLPPNISWQPPSNIPSPQPQQPHSINYTPEHNSLPLFQSSMSCRPKRTRKHGGDRSIITMSSRPQKKEHDIFMGVGKQCSNNNYDIPNGNGHPRWSSFPLNGGSDQTCVVPLNSIHHLHGRLRELDQHCRHLQFILKQQQRHSESVMHHCWQQNREEVSELQMHIKSLQEKLSRADMLIKDLYVENTYLMANNQRLEHRCHMLIQCNSESTSV